MEIQNFEVRGGYEKLRREIARDRRIRGRCSKNRDAGPTMEDMQNEAVLCLLKNYKRFAAECPAGDDVIDFVVFRVVRKVCDIARSARYGNHSRDKRPVEYKRESDFLQHDGSTDFEDEVGPARESANKYDGWFPVDYAEEAKAFEAWLAKHKHPMYDTFVTGQLHRESLSDDNVQELKRLYEISKSGKKFSGQHRMGYSVLLKLQEAGGMRADAPPLIIVRDGDRFNVTVDFVSRFLPKKRIAA